MKTTCGMFLFDKRGKFLICHPTGSPDDVWSIPKGIHEPGESYLESATRELLEETDIDLMKQTDVIEGVYELPKVNYTEKLKALRPFVVVTNVEFDESALVCTSIAKSINLPECDDFRWVTLKEGEHLIHETQNRSLKAVRSALRKHKKYVKEKAA